jgi:hypothetical protein
VAQFAVAALFERRNLLHQKAGGPFLRQSRLPPPQQKTKLFHYPVLE